MIGDFFFVKGLFCVHNQRHKLRQRRHRNREDRSSFVNLKKEKQKGTEEDHIYSRSLLGDWRSEARMGHSGTSWELKLLLPPVRVQRCVLGSNCTRDDVGSVFF